MCVCGHVSTLIHVSVASWTQCRVCHYIILHYCNALLDISYRVFDYMRVRPRWVPCASRFLLPSLCPQVRVSLLTPWPPVLLHSHSLLWTEEEQNSWASQTCIWIFLKPKWVYSPVNTTCGWCTWMTVCYRGSSPTHERHTSIQIRQAHLGCFHLALSVFFLPLILALLPQITYQRNINPWQIQHGNSWRSRRLSERTDGWLQAASCKTTCAPWGFV